MEQFFKCPKTLLRLRECLLGTYLDSFVKQLHDQGYAPSSVRYQINLVANFSQWLKLKGITVEEITSEHTKNYLRYLTQQRRLRGCEAATLRRLLDILRREGTFVEKILPSVQTPTDLLIDQFVLYLRQERSLACGTIIYYRRFVSHFLTDRFAGGKVNLYSLCAADVIGFVQRQAACHQVVWVKQMLVALRSFLRYARYQGYINIDLAASVPTVANWSKTSIPKSLLPDQVEAVLAHCNRQTVIGRRDYAILLLLARLGLRAGEIVSLLLDDIGWQAGLITVRGKGNHWSQLPLPIDVGEAIVAYLQNGRPQTTSRSLFLRGRAPVRGFKDQRTVGSVVRYAFSRAGINGPHKGAHLFRHSLATEMLRQGASLAEIGELLRHRDLQTTTIYAKVDLVSLRKLALPWPGGAK